MQLLFSILTLFFIGSCWGRPLEVEITARNALLMNAETGAILYEKHAYLPAFPASTTKIATALFSLEQKNPDLNQSALVSNHAMQMKPTQPGDYPSYWQEIDGTMMGLKRGEILTIDALFHGLMMISGNDAANVIAETLSGSVPQFVEELNSYLKSIGCQNTQYMNPHGLHHPEHFTTAYDLAVMMKRAVKIPKFRQLISQVSYNKPKTNKSPKAEITAFNPMIKPGRHYYPKSLGGKTGFHSHSRANLVSIAEHEGRTLIAVVMGCSKSGRYEDTKALFEAAFKERPVEQLLIGQQKTFTQSIEGAEMPLVAALPSDLTITYFPAEEPQCRAFVHWDALRLPIRKGDKVGEVRVQDETGRVLTSKPLISKEEVKGTFLFRVKSWVSSLF